MSISGDTMERDPNRGPTVKIPSKTVGESIAVVRHTLEEAYIDAIAVELPMQRHQRHDDEKAWVATEWACGSLEAFLRTEKETPRVRYEPVGATVIIRDGKSTPWVLIDPAYLENPVVRDLLQKASARCTPEVLASIHAAVEEDVEKANRATLEKDVVAAMKEDRQRSRGTMPKVYDPVKEFGTAQKGKKLSEIEEYWLQWCQSQSPPIIYRDVNWTRLSSWELGRREAEDAANRAEMAKELEK